MENYIIATEESCKTVLNEYQMYRFYEKQNEIHEINQNLVNKFQLMIHKDEHWLKIVVKVGDKFYSTHGSNKKYQLVEEVNKEAERRYSELPNRCHSVQDIERPNFIGKFTDKKVLEWVLYCEKCFETLEIEWEIKNEAIVNFLNEIHGQGFELRKNSSGKIVSGSIVRNGIEFSFNIERMYINKTMKIHYKVPTDFVSFQKLSDNGFGK